MKTKRFRLLTVLLTAVMLVALSLNVMAAKSNAVTQDGLTAQLFTDKDSYKAGESVKASVQVDNHTGREVFIFAQINVPEGVKLAGESTAFDALLKDGESWITSGGVLLSANSVATAGSSTATGDNMQAGFWIVLTVLAVAGIIALFVYGKNKKTWLSVFLCMSMVAGMAVAAVPARAADMNGDIELSCAIQVDGKDTEISATVSYVIYDEAKEEPVATEIPTAEPTATSTAEPTATPTAEPTQVVNMEFEGGATASLTMNAFNRGGRYIRIFGTKGELYANASDTEITLYTFEDEKHHKISVEKTEESIAGDHGGGDHGIVVELYDYLNNNYTGYCAADIETSVKNHLIGFAAEEARKEERVINVAQFSEKYGY